MQPALSVILLTTLIGAGQGLFLALYGAELAGYGGPDWVPEGRSFLALGAVLSVGISGLGLIASFFHLGHPERAWRAATMWRTSWLSREVIVLPAFMAGTLVWGVAHALGWRGTAWLGALVSLACLALFVCTAMIYASVRFLQEWASPFTLANYLLIGCASGATLATALAAWVAPELVRGYGVSALGLTLVALVSRWFSLARNARLKPRSTVQSAIGIRHPKITQRSMGFMGGSFNTREFFHGRAPTLLRSVKWGFLMAGFVVPALMLLVALASASPALLWTTFFVQFAGLLAERWFFFAQANHPQNLYYQVIS